MPDKRCSKCGEIKDESLFSLRSKKEARRRSACKRCLNGMYIPRERKQLVVDGKKFCNKCKEWVDVNLFYVLKNGKIKSLCKACDRKQAKKYRVQHNARLKLWQSKNKDRIREYYLNRTYGITSDEYAIKLASQDGVCAICGKMPEGKLLHVDHCHETGKIRGLLCFHCNRLLGSAYDSRAILHLADKYLVMHADSEQVEHEDCEYVAWL